MNRVARACGLALETSFPSSLRGKSRSAKCAKNVQHLVEYRWYSCADLSRLVSVIFHFFAIAVVFQYIGMRKSRNT